MSKTQGYRGTICTVDEAEYAVTKINGGEPKDVEQARDALGNLEKRISNLVTYLHWKDFEILVDLLFRQAGYQRISQLGKTQKALDLDLLSPVTNERIMVQVKSQSKADEFDHYCSEFRKMSLYQSLFYVVHSPDKSLAKVSTPKNVHLLLLNDVSKLSVRAGLSEWIISKSS